MRENLLEHLICPETGHRLTLEDAERDGDEVMGGRLVGGARPYPILDGIVSFVPDALREDQTVASFSEKWRTHTYYREHTKRFYTEWYLERYGYGDAQGLKDALAGARFILDAGTGAGRDATNLAAHSDATVFAVDTALPALKIAHGDLKGGRIFFVNADIRELPVPDGFFDYINCDQVIHHTPEPRVTFERLAAKLKPGGQICVYVYRKKAVLREFTDDYLREKIAPLGIDEAQAVCEPITKLGHALAKLDAKLEIEADIPELGIRAGSYDLQRFIHYNVMKCFWNDEFDFFTNNIVNVDWYHPVHCHRYEPEEFKAWFADGWDIVAWDERSAGLSCRAVKR